MTLYSLIRPLAASLCLSATLCHAQTPEKPRHLKNDQLLTQALAENGFGADVASPWHVRASFETFDEKGKHQNAGTFEEWWLGPKSYKSVLTSESFNQTDVATAAGLFRSGDPHWTDTQLNLIQRLLISPLSVRHYDPLRHDLVDETRPVGTSKMRCVFLITRPAPDARANGTPLPDLEQVPNVCFEPDSTVLRYSASSPGYYMVLNDVVRFHSHFVARTIQKVNAGKVSLTIRILEGSSLPPGTPEFTPPPGSVGPLGGRIELPPNRMEIVGGKLDIPPSSLRELATANLSVKLVIGKDGHVLEATTITAPPDMTSTVAKAARKLIFAPFTILDTPVEVETTFEVNFSQASSVSLIPGVR